MDTGSINSKLASLLSNYSGVEINKEALKKYLDAFQSAFSATN